MTETLRVHIGTLEDMGHRFVEAWKGAEQGKAVSEVNVTFRDLATLLTTLTPKRLDLLRHVRHHQVPTIKALATDLHRNYRNVHKDVETLAKMGLLSRTPSQVVVPYAKIEARFLL